ncbi:MAG: hypothetical protein OXM61_02290 [Candidatus Poribacteria bacterium]|nr:hypothetical protein [Candidatus Poribacteria bacterium]
MDYFVWSRIIGPLAIVIFVIYVIISSNRAVKELAQRKSESENRDDASIKSESAIPPIAENYKESPSEAEATQETVGSTEADIPIVAGQSEEVKAQEIVPDRKTIEPPSIPVDSRMALPTKPLPATSLLDLSPDTFRRGVILAEILGRPKGLRRKL